jgi:hypothetical protein
MTTRPIENMENLPKCSKCSKSVARFATLSKPMFYLVKCSKYNILYNIYYIFYILFTKCSKCSTFFWLFFCFLSRGGVFLGGSVFTPLKSCYTCYTLQKIALSSIVAYFQSVANRLLHFCYASATLGGSHV